MIETVATRTGTQEESTGRLADNIAYFARALRAAGLPVGPGAVLDALEAVKAAGIGSREDVYWTLHAVLVKRHEHTVLFDQAFRLFWRKRALLEKLMQMLMPMAPGGTAQASPPAARRVEDALFAKIGEPAQRPEPREVEIAARLTVSDAEVLRRKDFAQMTALEVAQAKRAIAAFRFAEDTVTTRRLVPDRHGHRVDLRRTLRASLKAGGDLIDLRFRGPSEKRPPVVALLDISGSMTEYTRLLLHFLHAITDSRKRVHTFLFATRLTNVTRELRARDPDEAFARCAVRVPDFEGGTRLADALHAFNRQWSRRVLGQGATVLLFTDGLEKQPGPNLAFELDRLRRSCRRLVWLNPLLRYDAFAPKARGIRLMLPHVDEFRPIHNLDSMAALCRVLSDADARAYDPRRWLEAA